MDDMVPRSCSICHCCSACNKGCSCQGVLASPKGMLKVLETDIPIKFKKIRIHLAQKIIEERMEDSDLDQTDEESNFSDMEEYSGTSENEDL